ncbi:rhomboid family intramembrane serine protease [Caldilinea sp.]|uniref:rhomboid family intramembrane serine protease n=1 Tax=Caldilinea sp. TaxID=2293560 RepID=UPI002626EF1D|nr:rhomboid family intramembrane serine protease [uncultured Caldilinea sp.]
MFPLRDTVQARSLPLMNWTLIAVNVLVFFMFLSGPHAEFWIERYALIPAQLFVNPTTWLTIFTSMFLHGGLFHLLGNMWALYIFGDNVEDRMGPVRFLIFYLLCGAAAALVHVLMNPGSMIPTVGASGAISGVMGAYLVLFPFARVITLVPLFFFPYFFEIPAIFFIGVWFAGQLVSAFMTSALAPPDVGGVAWWAHVGGFVAGMVLVRLFIVRRPVRHFYTDEYYPW